MTVLDAPTRASRERLRTEAAEARLVLKVVGSYIENPDAEYRREERWRAYKAFRTIARRLAGEAEWRESPIAQGLLDQTLELEERLEQDADATDPQWRVKEVADAIADLIATLVRELEHNALDEPATAARFVLDQLTGIDQEELGALLGVDPRTIRDWKASKPKTIRKNPDRVTLIAQLVYDLRRGMTPRGVVNWFERSRPQLDGRTAIELVSGEDIGLAAERLRPLARGIRGQLGT